MLSEKRGASLNGESFARPIAEQYASSVMRYMRRMAAQRRCDGNGGMSICKQESCHCRAKALEEQCSEMRAEAAYQ
jgi:hypothetical protein